MSIWHYKRLQSCLFICLSVCQAPSPTLKNNEPVPQALKQVVNLSCFNMKKQFSNVFLADVRKLNAAMEKSSNYRRRRTRSSSGSSRSSSRSPPSRRRRTSPNSGKAMAPGFPNSRYETLTLNVLGFFQQDLY